MTVATNIELPTKIVMRTIGAATACPYGTLMALTDENTVKVSSSTNDAFGGICNFEKVATDTDILKIPCAMDGLWDIACTSTVDVGSIVAMGGANLVRISNGTGDVVAGRNVGQAEETNDNVSLQVRLRG